MAKTIDAAVTYVRATVGAIDGIRNAPTGLPDNLSIYPAFVAWPGQSECYRESSDTVRGLWSIVGQLHFSRRDLGTAAAQATPFYRLIELALMTDPTMGGACDTYERILFSPLKPMLWGDNQTIGFEFTVSGIKIREDSAAT